MAHPVKYVSTPVLKRMLGKQAGTIKNLDPEGKHCLAWSMLHNDCEIRGLWMLKLTGTMVPYEVMLTVPIKAFNAAMDNAQTAEAAHEAGC